MLRMLHAFTAVCVSDVLLPWLPANAQESQLPDSANLRVLVALRNVFSQLKHSAASSPMSGAASSAAAAQLPPSRVASPFAALPGSTAQHAHHHSWGSDSLDSLVASSMAVRFCLSSARACADVSALLQHDSALQAQYMLLTGGSW